MGCVRKTIISFQRNSDKSAAEVRRADDNQCSDEGRPGDCEEQHSPTAARKLWTKEWKRDVVRPNQEADAGKTSKKKKNHRTLSK